MNAFSSPRQSEMLWWQPLAETPMNGFGMKHGNAFELAPDLAADLPEGREVVGGLLGAVEVEVELDLAGRVLVVALDHVEPERLPVLDHLVDDRLQLAELVDVVAVRLRDAADVGRAVLLQVEPHHLGLGAGAEVEPRRLPRTAAWIRFRLPRQSEVRKDAGILALLAVAEAGAPDARDLASQGSTSKVSGSGHADELGGLGAVADVVAVPVGEEVGGRAVDELEALRGHALPVRGGHALAHDPARDRDELVVDVRDALGVDATPDLGDQGVAALRCDEAVEIGCHARLLFRILRSGSCACATTGARS